MNELSEYEKLRLRNIEYNRSVLRSLEIPGLVEDLVRPKPVAAKRTQGVKRKRNYSKKKIEKNNVKSFDVTPERKFNGYLTRSKRSRLISIENGDLLEEPLNKSCADDDSEDDPDYRKGKPKFTENIYGSIPDIPIGTVWQYRMGCSRDGVHRPTVAGIHGSETYGCYSIALSGGYEDDLDYGECFTYTGEGGRDLKGTRANPKNLRTAEQSKNQTLTKGNLALSKNVANRKPVRVVRGYKLESPYAPEEGYRYDGLYTVEKFWKATGQSGFAVYKFALKRCSDQAPPPWLNEVQDNAPSVGERPVDSEEHPAGTSENVSGTDDNDSCYGSEEITSSKS